MYGVITAEYNTSWNHNAHLNLKRNSFVYCILYHARGNAANSAGWPERFGGSEPGLKIRRYRLSQRMTWAIVFLVLRT